MATFSDMVTLLLAFFVMLVAMSEVEVKKFDEALSYFKGHTGMLEHEMALVAGPATPASAENQAVQQADRYEELLEQLAEAGLSDAVEVALTAQGIHLTVLDSVMFASGTAALLPAAERVLSAVAGVVGHDVQGIVVEGHTDSIPIQTATFPSNWELSTARAASVVRFFLDRSDALPPDRYQAAGYAEHRPRASNATADGRAQNRRVAILISTHPWPTPTLPTPTLPTPAP
jgi:chemotaxis protein MotB